MLTKLRQKIQDNLSKPLREASTTGNTKPYVAGPLKAGPPPALFKSGVDPYKTDKSKLYNYMFHFNHHTGRWAAFKREDQQRYFNNYERHAQTGIIYAERFEDIVDFLTKL